jgi:hypothetical protein
MKITQDSPADGRALGNAALRGAALGAFTPESIRPVRDFTARKTLEQAHAFVAGLTGILADAGTDEADQALLTDLASVGITGADAELLATEALALIERMADRDRKAEIFHAAVKEAGQGERAMYERLAALARVLRLKLGPRAPALTRFGVPAEPEGEARPRPKTLGKAIFSAAIAK